MDRIFHGYKIRYELLNQQFLPVRASQKIRSVNIFINLDDFFHKMHKPYTNDEFQTTGKNVSKQLVSNLMNLIGHYKNWAIKEHLYPSIFLIYTTASIFKNQMLIQDYRQYYNKIMEPNNPDFFHINSAIINGYSILQVMTKYIPGAYAVDTNYLEPSMVPLYLSRILPADYNLLVSRDEYDLQYTAYDKWAVIAPRGDVSSFIVKGNLWTYVCRSQGIDEPHYFHPDVFTWTKTIIGDKYRSIPKLTRTGWKTILKYMKTVSTPDSTPETLQIQLNRVAEFVNKKKIQDTNFNNNLYCVSVQQQADALLDTDKVIIKQQLEDMLDVQALYHANATVFKEFPLNLPFLLREAPPPGSVPHDDYFWKRNFK